MITLYLLRHCDYANPLGIMPGRLPVELSAKGLEQANGLQKFFADKNITKIYSSAVLRCKQTVEIISNNKIPIEYDKRLLETLSPFQGYWEINWKMFFNMRAELGGECNLDIQNRMVDFFAQTNFFDDNSYIICSHGDPLYFLYQYFAKTPLLSDIVHDEHALTPEDYQPKGSIRTIILDNHKNVLEILPLIDQVKL